jgi:hypothetical protein
MSPLQAPTSSGHLSEDSIAGGHSLGFHRTLATARELFLGVLEDPLTISLKSWGGLHGVRKLMGCGLRYQLHIVGVDPDIRREVLDDDCHRGGLLSMFGRVALKHKDGPLTYLFGLPCIPLVRLPAFNLFGAPVSRERGNPLSIPEEEILYNSTTPLRSRQIVRSGPCWRAQVKPDGPIDSSQSKSPGFDRLGVRCPNHQTLKLASELLKGQPVWSDTSFPQSGGLGGRRYPHARKRVPNILTHPSHSLEAWEAGDIRMPGKGSQTGSTPTPFRWMRSVCVLLACPGCECFCHRAISSW